MKTKGIVAMIVLASAVLKGALTPGEVTAGQKGIIGAWIINVTPDPPGPPPFRNIGSFGPGGLNVNYDPDFGAGQALEEDRSPGVQDQVPDAHRAGSPLLRGGDDHGHLDLDP